MLGTSNRRQAQQEARMQESASTASAMLFTTASTRVLCASGALPDTDPRPGAACGPRSRSDGRRPADLDVGTEPIRASVQASKNDRCVGLSRRTAALRTATSRPSGSRRRRPGARGLVPTVETRRLPRRPAVFENGGFSRTTSARTDGGRMASRWSAFSRVKVCAGPDLPLPGAPPAGRRGGRRARWRGRSLQPRARTCRARRCLRRAPAHGAPPLPHSPRRRARVGGGRRELLVVVLLHRPARLAGQERREPLDLGERVAGRVGLGRQASDGA